MGVDDVIYAELSVGFERIEALDDVLDRAGVTRQPIPSPALFLSGKAFRRYRARGGHRTGVLPDVFIGAHAAVTGVPLPTRDGRRYRTYFPTLDLILPEGLGNP